MNKIQNIKCDGCGATLKFKSGTNHLSCEYCGHNIRITQAESRTGEVQGGRPYSLVKISLFILTMLGIVYGVYTIDWKSVGEQLSAL